MPVSADQSTDPLDRQPDLPPDWDRSVKVDPVTERVRRRAYELWEQEGRPPGRELEHWALAEREVLGREGK